MKCTECSMENIEGAIFCEECGAKLEISEMNGAADGSEAEGMLVLKSGNGSTLEIPAKAEVVIGREDPVSECSLIWI